MIAEAYKYFRWLSLDIVLGAIFFLAFFEKYYLLDLHGSTYFALGSTIWIIYNIDHLIDSMKYAGSPRRYFHRKWSKLILVTIGLVLILSCLNVYSLPVVIIRNGALLLAACVGYLMLIFFFRGLWMKEVIVAFGYATGLLLAPFSFLEQVSLLDVVLWIQLAIIALINLMVFSVYDFSEDEQGQFGSLVTRMGLVLSRKVIHGLIIIVTLSALLLWHYQPGIASVQQLYLSITIVLTLVFHLPQYFSLNERFRVIGDAVFYLPLFFLWW